MCRMKVRLFADNRRCLKPTVAIFLLQVYLLPFSYVIYLLCFNVLPLQVVKPLRRDTSWGIWGRNTAVEGCYVTKWKFSDTLWHEFLKSLNPLHTLTAYDRSLCLIW